MGDGGGLKTPKIFGHHLLIVPNLNIWIESQAGVYGLSLWIDSMDGVYGLSMK